MTENEIREFYNCGAEKYASMHPPGENSDVVYLQNSLPDHNPRVLDVGCGCGSWAGYFQAEKYIGLDIAEKMLEMGRGFWPKRTFVQGAATRLPFPEESFGGVVATCSFPHLSHEETVMAVKEIHRVLVRGGVCLLALSCTPRKSHVYEVVSDYNGKPFQIMSYSQSDAALLARSAGFRTFHANMYLSHGLASLFLIKK